VFGLRFRIKNFLIHGGGWENHLSHSGVVWFDLGFGAKRARVYYIKLEIHWLIFGGAATKRKRKERKERRPYPRSPLFLFHPLYHYVVSDTGEQTKLNRMEVHIGNMYKKEKETNYIIVKLWN
jgi:hypothetical protein